MATDRVFSNPAVGQEIRIEQYDKEVHLIFVASTQAKSNALVENLLTQLKAGAVNITVMGKPSQVREGWK